MRKGKSSAFARPALFLKRGAGETVKKQAGETVKKQSGDVFLLVAVFLLSAIGCVFIYSASSYSAQSTYHDAFYFVKKQIIGIALGAAAMLFTANFPYRKLKKFAFIFAVIALVLLALVFVPFLGVENYGAKRWIGIGSLTVQPSEIAKFAFILFTAAGKCGTGFYPVIWRRGIY